MKQECQNHSRNNISTSFQNTYTCGESEENSIKNHIPQYELELKLGGRVKV